MNGRHVQFSYYILRIVHYGGMTCWRIHLILAPSQFTKSMTAGPAECNVLFSLWHSNPEYVMRRHFKYCFSAFCFKKFYWFWNWLLTMCNWMQLYCHFDPNQGFSVFHRSDDCIGTSPLTVRRCYRLKIPHVSNRYIADQFRMGNVTAFGRVMDLKVKQIKNGPYPSAVFLLFYRIGRSPEGHTERQYAQRDLL